MFNWLDNMRRQPMSKRRLVAFSITLLFVGALFVVWLTVWLPDFNKQNEIADKNEQFISPKDNFMENFSTAWGAISSQFSELKDSLQNVDLQDNLSGSAQYTSTSTATSTSITGASKENITVIEVSSTTEQTGQN